VPEHFYKPTTVIAYMNGFIISRQKEPSQIISPDEEILAIAGDLIVKAYI
jgi:macrolide-specific efflux system membrane fusion protein